MFAFELFACMHVCFFLHLFVCFLMCFLTHFDFSFAFASFFYFLVCLFVYFHGLVSHGPCATLETSRVKYKRTCTAINIFSLM